MAGDRSRVRRAYRLADLDDRTVSIIRAFIAPADGYGHQAWTGGFSTGGTPMIALGNIQVLVRSIVAEMSGAELPPVGDRRFSIVNQCGNPLCVRFDVNHNAIIRYGAKITDVEKEDALRRWAESGNSLDARCPAHGTVKRVSFRRPKKTGRAYVNLRCNACDNERVAVRAKAAVAKRNDTFGEDLPWMHKGYAVRSPASGPTGDMAEAEAQVREIRERAAQSRTESRRPCCAAYSDLRVLLDLYDQASRELRKVGG